MRIVHKTLDDSYSYPPKLVRFEMTSHGIVGSCGTLASYKMKTPTKAKPMISGARTAAELQGWRPPPHVSPMTARVAPVMMIRFPLDEQTM